MTERLNNRAIQPPLMCSCALVAVTTAVCVCVCVCVCAASKEQLDVVMGVHVYSIQKTKIKVSFCKTTHMYPRISDVYYYVYNRLFAVP